MRNLSIVISEAYTLALKGLEAPVPFAVVLPNSLCVVDTTIHGLALYGSALAAPFEMTIEDFEKLDFGLV